MKDLLRGATLGLAALLGAIPQGALASDSPASSAAPKKSSAELLEEKVRCEKLPQKTEADLWNLAECFYKIGVTNTTLNILKSLIQRNPKDLDAYFTSAWLFWENGRSLGGAEERKAISEALNILGKARLSNPTHWKVDVELGDFYYLRMNRPEQAYAEYIKARKHYDGDYARNVLKASQGERAAIEDRIARTTERMGRRGEAVEASCRALYFDPDDKSALDRIDRLGGSCTRKKVPDPRNSTESEPSL